MGCTSEQQRKPTVGAASRWAPRLAGRAACRVVRPVEGPALLRISCVVGVGRGRPLGHVAGEVRHPVAGAARGNCPDAASALSSPEASSVLQAFGVERRCRRGSARCRGPCRPSPTPPPCTAACPRSRRPASPPASSRRRVGCCPACWGTRTRRCRTGPPAPSSAGARRSPSSARPARCPSERSALEPAASPPGTLPVRGGMAGATGGSRPARQGVSGLRLARTCPRLAPRAAALQQAR